MARRGEGDVWTATDLTRMKPSAMQGATELAVVERNGSLSSSRGSGEAVWRGSGEAVWRDGGEAQHVAQSLSSPPLLLLLYGSISPFPLYFFLSSIFAAVAAG
ncbi:hypothetical protein S245_066552 [Arachis hypogaea]